MPQNQCSQCGARTRTRRLLCQTKSRIRWVPCARGCPYHPGRRLMLAERFAAAQRAGLTGAALAAYRPCACVELDFATIATVIHCPAWQVRDGRRVYPPPPPPPHRVPDFVYLGVDEETEQRLRQAETSVLLDGDAADKNRLVPLAIYATAPVVRAPKVEVEVVLADTNDTVRIVMISDYARDSMRFMYAADGQAIQGITYDVDLLPKTTKVTIYEAAREHMYRPAEYKVIQEIHAGAKELAVQLGYIKAV